MPKSVSSDSTERRFLSQPTAPLFDDLSDSAFIRAANLVQSRPGKQSSGPLPFSLATLWRLVAAGKFPRPSKLSERMTAWRVGDVRAWLQAQSPA